MSFIDKLCQKEEPGVNAHALRAAINEYKNSQFTANQFKNKLANDYNLTTAEKSKVQEMLDKIDASIYDGNFVEDILILVQQGIYGKNDLLLRLQLTQD